MNHISDFGSPGGVQTYLCSLAKNNNRKFNLYSFSKPLKIYLSKNNSYKINIINIVNIFKLICDYNIIHNLILSKKWLIYLFFSKLFRKKIIYHEHGISWHNPFKNKKIYNKRISSVDILIVNSLATKKLLINIYKIKNEINILRSPIFLYEEANVSDKDFSIAKKYDFINTRNSEIIIGYLGRLDKHKNPIFLIKVADYLKKNFGIKTRLQFIGKGTELDSLKDCSKALNIDSEFLGLVRDRRKATENWHFAIVPSIREPLGLVQGEMALLNTICLSSDIDGIPEMYPDSCNFLKIKMLKNKEINVEKENYQYCPSLEKFEQGLIPDIIDCSNKIVELINNPDYLKKLLKNHKEFILKNFNISDHSKKLEKIISN
tara:strand:- start:63 stop:1190 length:1128 start_codon:yes stop_codon:yes gene_type:complete